MEPIVFGNVSVPAGTKDSWVERRERQEEGENGRERRERQEEGENGIGCDWIRLGVSAVTEFSLWSLIASSSTNLVDGGRR